MKKNPLILFLSLSLVLVGCSSNPSSNKQSSQEKDLSYRETSVTIDSSYGDKKYDLPFSYSDTFFKDAPSKFNKDLALLSYGLSLASQDKESNVKFYKDLDFTSAEYAEEYNDKPKVNGVGYSFATKTIDGYNVVAASIRGFNYRIQWVDNFRVGEEGNHEGFDDSAEQVKEALDTYISKIKNDKPFKLWLSGYSRGGAIANVLASKILSSQSGKINKNNLYTYTFEAPRALSKENAAAYDNVFNVINSGDIFTKVCPEEYGLYRCGKDIDIYTKNVDQLIKAFDSEAVVPEFKSSILYSDDARLASYLISCLLQGDEPDEGERNWSLSTRDLYNLNYGEDIRYIATIINVTENVTLTDILLRLQSMSTAEISALLLGTGMSFVSLIEGILDDLQVAYEAGDLEKTLTELFNYVKQPSVALAITSLLSKDTGVRVIDMHRPDTNYILLNAYEA